MFLKSARSNTFENYQGSDNKYMLVNSLKLILGTVNNKLALVNCIEVN